MADVTKTEEAIDTQHVSARTAASDDPGILTSDDRPPEHVIKLKARIEELTASAREMSKVLPRAVALSAHGGGLAEAMTPAVERAISISGKRDPRHLAEALLPIMGMVFRRWLAESLKSGLRAINHVMLRYTSAQGWQWRREARQRNVPVSQVFHEHTQSLPVKQVFLIHRETGILLQQAQSETDIEKDWDIVSGMLTALADFIHDAFSVGHDQGLETIRVGELTVIVEQGRRAALAGVLRGEAPDDLRDQFATTLDKIHAEFGHELEAFDGETSIFDKSRPVLETCLGSLVSTDQTRMLPQTLLAVALPIIVAAIWGAVAALERHRWTSYVSHISEEPGIVIIEEGKRNGRYYVNGLRDPTAVNPKTVLMERGFVLADVDSRWASYQAMHSTLTLPRLELVLDPPETITLSMEDGMLIMRGSAPTEWMDGALAKLKGLTGLSGYRTDGLIVSDLNESRRWHRLISGLESEPGIVVFASGRRNDRYFISGLRDPLARDPASILKEHNIPQDHVDSRWQPYQALDPSLTLIRARQVLAPPETVSLAIRNDSLIAAGSAPYSWISEARVLARSIPGIRILITDALMDEDLLKISIIQRAIHKQVFRFLVGSVDLWPGQAGLIDSVMKQIEELNLVAKKGGRNFRVDIMGFAESSGDAVKDRSDSADLIDSFIENLQVRGIDLTNFSKKPMGSAPPPHAGSQVHEARNRVVCLRVVLEES